MLGLMTAGLLAFRRGRWAVGTVVLTVAVLVKARAGVALLCAAAVAVAGRAGAWPRVRQAAGIAGVAVAALVAGVAVCGQGWGWLWTLRTPAEVRTLLSLSTERAGCWVARRGAGVGHGGRGDDGRAAGRAAGGAGRGGLLGAVRPGRGRRGATGLALLVLVASAPVVQPWYVLWAVVPLAAVSWRRLGRGGAKAAMVGLTLVVMPSGHGPPGRAGSPPPSGERWRGRRWRGGRLRSGRCGAGRRRPARSSRNAPR